MTKSRRLSRTSLVVSALAWTVACGDATGSLDHITEPVVVENAVCRVEYVVTGQWGTGFGADVTVTNKQGAAIQNWTLSWDFPSGQRITSLWNGTYTQSGARVDVRGPSWSPSIAAGASLTVGFNGSYGGTNQSPASFELSGVDCGSSTGSGGSGAAGSSGGTDGSGGSTAASGGSSGSASSGGSGGSSSCNYPKWQQGTYYSTGAIVEYQGAYYIAEHENPGYSPTISTWFWDPYTGTCDGSGGAGGSSGSAGTGGSGGTAGSGGSSNVTWRTANLTNFESYPDPNSEECIYYNGCTWAGQFAALDGKQPESWVMANNIAAVHSKDFEKYKLKTLRLRMGSDEIDVKVYDMCSDNDCSGCCTANASETGFLIDIEKYTMQRFGHGHGIVEWRCLDCD